MSAIVIIASFTAFYFVHYVWRNDSKPNILLLVSDDKGFGNFGFEGNKLMRTLNLSTPWSGRPTKSNTDE